MNEKWLREMGSRSLRIVLEDFHNVRNQTMRRLEAFSEQEFNDPKYYRWLRGKPLFVWVAADTFEHETEHYAQIKDWKDKRSGV